MTDVCHLRVGAAHKSSRQAKQGGCLQKQHTNGYEKQVCCLKVTEHLGIKFLAWACASTICAAKKLHLE